MKCVMDANQGPIERGWFFEYLRAVYEKLRAY